MSMSTFFKVMLIGISLMGVRDVDMDGFPDSAELRTAVERFSFRKWFVWIAVSVADGKIHIGGVHDCASFVSAVYREALKRHNRLWAKQVGASGLPPIPDRRSFYYPDVPLIGKRLFRIQPGAFSDTSQFSESVTGEYLVKFNMVRLGKDTDAAEDGDLIVFYHAGNRMPYHIMIFYRANGRPMVVYHTGPDGDFRIITLRKLMEHPDASWHPAPSNPCFLGVYRWKIMER